jgi:hypothetical protein
MLEYLMVQGSAPIQVRRDGTIFASVTTPKKIHPNLPAPHGMNLITITYAIPSLDPSVPAGMSFHTVQADVMPADTVKFLEGMAALEMRPF